MQNTESAKLGAQVVCRFLKNCDYYMLATVEGKQPRVRPFGTAVIFEDRLYIETLYRKRVAKQIKENPLVEICAMSRDGHAWIRVAGTLVEDQRIEPKEVMLEEYPFLKNEIAVTDPDLAVYYFRDAVAWISEEGKPDSELHF